MQAYRRGGPLPRMRHRFISSDEDEDEDENEDEFE